MSPGKSMLLHTGQYRDARQLAVEYGVTQQIDNLGARIGHAPGKRYTARRLGLGKMAYGNQLLAAHKRVGCGAGQEL